KDGTDNLFVTLGPVSVIVGIVVAAISAGVAVKWLVGVLGRRGLAPFGWYRILLFVVLTLLIGAGIIRINPPSSENTRPPAAETSTNR
ncbi:MAG TPA: hypothetical protein VK176_06925, partial [Phycisphaerales bacterium]|nr:hypothetical protein [Phycisphaerales bacterium]